MVAASRPHVLALLGAVVAAATALGACGARSDLLVPGDRAPVPLDAGDDGTSIDGSPETSVIDASTDAPSDASVPDAPIPTSCVDAGITYVYAITQQNLLYRFYPPTSAFDVIGAVQCTGETSSPFSMGVDRQGIAWVVFMDGTLFRVDTASAACELSPYPTDQLGWLTFGMAFAATTDAGSSDALFVAESSYQHASLGLGRIDLTSFALKAIGPFAPPLSNAVELTGTGDGRLYAFSLNSGAAGSHLSQIDETSGKILGDVSLPTVGTPNSSFAFAYWGGDFYFFTAPQSVASTTVTRYRPGDGSVTPVASLAETVVGVGVSTCAPQ